MARERSRHHPEQRRRRAASDPLPDPIGRLDDVLATLEQLLDGHGVPPAGPPDPARREVSARDLDQPAAIPVLRDVVAPGVNGDAEGTGGAAAGPVRADAEAEAEAVESGAGVDRAAGGAAGRDRREAEAPEAPEAPEDPGTAPALEPLSLGFEFIADDPVPRIGDLGLDPPAGDPDAGPEGGPDAGPEDAPGGERYGDAPPPALDPEVYRHLIDRLANEIDVIVQTGTEEAMRRAAADIAARVREHVAIILPEVIEELVRMSDRPPD